MPGWSAKSDASQQANSIVQVGCAAHGTRCYLAYIAAGALLIRRSEDEGWSWSSEVQVAPAADEFGLTNMLFAEDNFVHIIYEPGVDLLYRRSTDWGATWSAATTLHSGSANHFYRASLKAINGIVHAAYVHHDDTTFLTDDIFYRRSLDNGVTWQTEQTLYTGSSTPGRPGMDVVGSTVHLTWTDLRNGGTVNEDDQIYYGRSLDSGANWQTEVQITSGKKICLRADVVAEDEMVVLAWQMSHNDTTTPTTLEIYTVRSTDNGVSFGSAVRQTNDSMVDEHVFFASRRNRIAMVWSQNDVNQDTLFKYSDDFGATWSSVETAQDTFDLGAPQLVISDYYYTLIGGDGTDIYRASRPIVDPASGTVLDDFNAADDSTPPIRNWVDGILTNVAGEGLVITTNQVARLSTGGYRQGSYYYLPMSEPDLMIAVEISAWTDTVDNGFALYTRLKDLGNPANVDGYTMSITVVNATPTILLDFARADNGTPSGVASIVTDANVGDIFGLETKGDRIRAWRKPSGGSWTVLWDFQDKVYPDANYIGLEMLNNQETKITNLFATPVSASRRRNMYNKDKFVILEKT